MDKKATPDELEQDERFLVDSSDLQIEMPPGRKPAGYAQQISDEIDRRRGGRHA